MRYITLIAIALTLASCGDSDEVRAQRFGQSCAAADFNVKQCELLWAMSEQSRDDANSARTMAAIGIGMSAAAGAQVK